MSCSLHDVIRIESLGTPALALGTEPFQPEAREQAEVLGMPDQRMLALPHPIQPRPLQEVVDLADRFFADITAHLTDIRQ